MSGPSSSIYITVLARVHSSPWPLKSHITYGLNLQPNSRPIAERRRARAEQQRLLRGDAVLDRDLATLAACGVRDGDTLHLVRQVARTGAAAEVGREIFAAAMSWHNGKSDEV